MEIADTKIRYGVNRIHVFLKREGWKDNKKPVHSIYNEEGLDLLNKCLEEAKWLAIVWKDSNKLTFTNVSR